MWLVTDRNKCLASGLERACVSYIIHELIIIVASVPCVSYIIHEVIIIAASVPCVLCHVCLALFMS